MLTLPLHPLAEVLLLTTGTLLVLLELHRPGWILPGCLGILSLLIAAASAARTPYAGQVIGSMVAAILFAVLDSRFPHILIGFALWLSCFVCFLMVVPAHGTVMEAFALAVSLALAIPIHHFARIAHIARTNKFPPATSKHSSPAQKPLD